jgi:hypothetical protein
MFEHTKYFKDCQRIISKSHWGLDAFFVFQTYKSKLSPLLYKSIFTKSKSDVKSLNSFHEASISDFKTL